MYRAGVHNLTDRCDWVLMRSLVREKDSGLNHGQGGQSTVALELGVATSRYNG